MTNELLEKLSDWAHAITAETQFILHETGRVKSAETLSRAMRELDDAIQNEPITDK